jgi:hypothetical protein
MRSIYMRNGDRASPKMEVGVKFMISENIE